MDEDSIFVPLEFELPQFLNGTLTLLSLTDEDWYMLCKLHKVNIIYIGSNMCHCDIKRSPVDMVVFEIKTSTEPNLNGVKLF